MERPANELATGGVEGLEGEFDMSDIQIPRLNLIGKTSKMVSRETPAGFFVLNKETVVGDGEKPFRLIVINIAKEYWQKLPEGSQERPMVFKTLREVREAGGSVEYGAEKKGDLQFQSCGRVTCLIESDEEKPGFIFEADGKFYAPAIWFLSGTTYGAVGKKFVSDSQITLRKSGISSRFYEITSKIESNAKGSWYLPQARLTTQAPPEELMTQVRELFGSNQ